MPIRDRYDRVVVWMTNQGHIFDLPGRLATAGATPTVRDDRLELATGDETAVERTRTFELRVTQAEGRDFVRWLARQDCGCRLAALSTAGSHEYWTSLARPELVEARDGPLGFAGGVLRLENRIYAAGNWQAYNLIEGVPWYGSVAEDDGDGDFLLESPTLIGYEGPKWLGSDGDSVDFEGEATIADALTLNLEFPVWGALVRMLATAGTLEAVGWAGDVLESVAAGEDLLIPDETWSLRLVVTEATNQPVLDVVRVGRAREHRVGGFDTDCATRIELPAWVSIDPDPEPTGALILATTGGPIRLVDRDGDLVDGTTWGDTDLFELFGAFHVDYVTKRIYYGVKVKGEVNVQARRVNFDGTDDVLIFQVAGDSQFGVNVAVENVEGRVYLFTIQRLAFADLDGSNLTSVTPSENPHDLKMIDGAGRHYIADSTNIRRMLNSNGSREESFGIATRSIAVDPIREHVFFHRQTTTPPPPRGPKRKPVFDLTGAEVDVTDANTTTSDERAFYVLEPWLYFKRANNIISRVHLDDYDEVEDIAHLAAGGARKIAPWFEEIV